MATELVTWTITHFNPLPPQGKTRQQFLERRMNEDISIHFPHRGRHHQSIDVFHLEIISIHFPHRGRHWDNRNYKNFKSISIHFPHRGRHYTYQQYLKGRINISIHFPHRGRHAFPGNHAPDEAVFQSTSPTGEDTSSPIFDDVSILYFNPLPPQGKTQQKCIKHTNKISKSYTYLPKNYKQCNSIN